MKQIRFCAAIVVCILAYSSGRVCAQIPTSVQRIYFAFVNDYENDNFYTTYSGTNAVSTNEVSLIRTVEDVTGNVNRAIYYLENGSKWSNLAGSEIVREVNMTNGAEGIFLRGYGRQTNISELFSNSFGGSYLNDFTAQVPTQFAGSTNNFTTAFPLHRGSEQFRPGQPTITNNIRWETMFFVSFNTPDMKFNFLGYGPYITNLVQGRVVPGGTLYHTNIESFYAHGIGTMYRIGGSNIFNVFTNGAVPPVTNTGPFYGQIWTGTPYFLATTNGPQ